MWTERRGLIRAASSVDILRGRVTTGFSLRSKSSSLMRLACYSGTAYRNACNLIKMSCLAQPATFGNNNVLTKWINETLTLHDPLGNHSFRFFSKSRQYFIGFSQCLIPSCHFMTRSSVEYSNSTFYSNKITFRRTRSLSNAVFFNV